MRAIHSIYLLSLVLTGSPALPQSAQNSPSPPTQRDGARIPEAKIEEARARTAEFLKTCFEDWDQATHMSKGEWIATCRRLPRGFLGAPTGVAAPHRRCW